MPVSTKPEIEALLRDAGIENSVVEALIDIDGLLQKWRRRAQKRELGQRALVHLKLGIDLAQFDVLSAIKGSAFEFGEGETGETMVATVAERLNIDPSRASRIVGDVVDQGFARRAVSQADARRTIIELTERGRAVVDAVRAYKYIIMGDFLAEWDETELATFVPLLKRFAHWMDGIDPATERYAGKIAALAQSVEIAGDTEDA